MRRLLGVLSLIGLGLLMGFTVRLVWPRQRPSVYDTPGSPVSR